MRKLALLYMTFILPFLCLAAEKLQIMKLISLHHLKQRNNSQKKQMLPATKLFLLKLQLNPNRKQIINPKFSLHIFLRRAQPDQ